MQQRVRKMAPYYPNLVLLAGMKLSLEETAIRNKVLYTLVMEIISEQNAEEVPTLEVRNTLPTCPSLTFMKVTRAKKEADSSYANKQDCKKKSGTIHKIAGNCIKK